MEKVWRLLKKLQIDLPYDPTIALLGIYSKDYKLLNKKVTREPRLFQMSSE
jgi:hypothetical protein